jgi:hypothetical protein
MEQRINLINIQIRSLKTSCKSLEKEIKEVDVLILSDPSDNSLRERRESLIYSWRDIDMDIYGLKGELEDIREWLARREE